MTNEVLFSLPARGIEEAWCARLLVRSLRKFGGPLCDSPVLILDGRKDGPAIDFDDENTHSQPLEMDEVQRAFPLAVKAVAAAQAEAYAAGRCRTLVVLFPACLVFNPPMLFTLEHGEAAAVRPVHIQNVGLQPGEPLDPYWQRVFESTGTQDTHRVVESFIDRQVLRFYINAGSFSVDPSLGLMRRWLECLDPLLRDEAFLAGPCETAFKRIFLHQAVLSALLAQLSAEQVRILPPDYAYPVHLHDRAPSPWAGVTLDRVTSIIYDELFTDPIGMHGMAMSPDLHRWLENQAGQKTL
jgi:hypothetical protein